MEEVKIIPEEELEQLDVLATEILEDVVLEDIPTAPITHEEAEVEEELIIEEE